METKSKDSTLSEKRTILEKSLSYGASLCISLGGLILVVFLYKLHHLTHFATSERNIDTDLTSAVSNFVQGWIGTLWSLAGVILFYLALTLQRKEIKIQIKELNDTREVFITQQFESTFFNLLKTQQDIRENTSFKRIMVKRSSGSRELLGQTKEQKEEQIFSSYEFFIFIHKELIIHYREIKKSTKQTQIGNTAQHDLNLINNSEFQCRWAYSKIFKEYQPQLSHFFRSLYHLLNYLHQQELAELQFENANAEKVLKKYIGYAQFVQAQLSNCELLLLFYNALFFDKMKMLLHHYNFLENLTTESLLDINDAKFYAEWDYNGTKYPAITFKSIQQTFNPSELKYS